MAESPLHELFDRLQKEWGQMALSGSFDGPSKGGSWMLDISLRGKRTVIAEWRPTWGAHGGFGVTDARHDMGYGEGHEEVATDATEAHKLITRMLEDPTGMRPQRVVVGAALYEFPDRKAMLKFLKTRLGPEKIDVRVNARDFGAAFIGRAPWDASSYEDTKKLLEMIENLDKDDIDP